MRELNERPTQPTGEQPKDDRRGVVNPAENPMPQSPPPDSEAVRRGQETWHSVCAK